MERTKYTGNIKTKRIRKIAHIWATVIIVYTLLLLIGYAWSWLTTGKADPHSVEGTHPPILFLGILGLPIAWRWEGLGGAITVFFVVAHLVEELIRWLTGDEIPRLILWFLSNNLPYSWVYYLMPYLIWMIIVTPGILFLICWYRSRSR